MDMEGASEKFEVIACRIATLFGIAATPAEIRALSGHGDEMRSWGVDDVRAFLREKDIESELVATPAELSVRDDDAIGLVVADGGSWIIARDALNEKLFAENGSGGGRVSPEEMQRKIDADGGRVSTCLRFFRPGRERMGVIPGIERHWFWGALWRSRSLYVQASLAAVITNFFALGVSMFSMVVYNSIIPANALTSLAVLVVGMLLLLTMDYFVKSARSHVLGYAGIDADVSIADRLFAQVIDLQYQAKKGSVGSLANTLKEFEQIRDFFTSATLVSLIDTPFALLFLAVIALIGGWMVVPVLIGIGIMVAVTLYVQPRLKALAQVNFEDGQTKHSVMVETLTGLETIKMLGAGGLMRRRFRHVINRQADLAEESKNYTMFAGNVAQAVQQAVQVGVVAVGAILVKDGVYGYGAIIGATILAGKAVAPFAQLAALLVRLNQVMVGYKALEQLMSEPTERPAQPNYLSRGRFRGGIEFREVSFSYPGQQGLALDKVSFRIEPGEKVAVLGRIGSGKTTLSRLMAGVYAPTSGTILFDGVDMRQIDPAEIRENLGVVLQDLWLMAGSVEQNISLGSFQVPPEDILWAGALSGVSEFADTHPQGYKLHLKERGEGLSGGQRQAIALARALVRRPPILVLDEPSSAMDTRTEQGFVQRFKQAALGCSIVLITHRTSLLTLADRVIVMDQGRLVGSASTEQFLAARENPAVARGIARDTAPRIVGAGQNQ